MKVSELAAYVGKSGLLTLPASGMVTVAFYCTVVVKDAKSSFGRVFLLVEPADGGGQAWVESSRVRLFREAGDPEVTRSYRLAALAGGGR